MDKNRLDTPRTIIGQILPREQDNSMFGIEIMTDEGSFSVELEGADQQLLDLLYRDIRATGVIAKNRDGNKRIVLKDYEVLDS
jgi:hypothetical protein